MVLERLARRWIAGIGMKDALGRAREANARGYNAIINFLGEHITDKNVIQEAVNEYQGVIRSLKEQRIRGCISVKPTQLGLRIGRDYCRENLVRLASSAREAGTFMWLDMEGSKFTEDTIGLYESILAEYPEVGIAIQAYLKRSIGDLEALTIMGGKIRLVKGAYREPAEIAYASKEEVDASYLRLMEYLFENGEEFAIATHDDRIIRRAVELNRKWNKKVEFEMLMGIRDELKQKLASEGLAVASYIPYGGMWMTYALRRMRERKSNILLVIRSLFGG